MHLKWNGHTHTQFCRHGSPADMSEYIEMALELGFQRYTLSEHPPLPERWINDPVLMSELAMEMTELPDYFTAAEQMKERYRDRIEVMVGLELDYLPGRTDFSESFLAPYIDRLDDALISVHYLPGTGGMRCIDYKPDDFREGLIDYYGSMEKVVSHYYDHVEQAIEWAGTLPIARKRIGHINLIEKFSLALPAIDPDQMRERLERIVPLLRENNLGLDVNTAGLRVPTCGKPYVPEWLLRRCSAEDIPCVFGSDAHKPQDAGAGWDWFGSLFPGN